MFIVAPTTKGDRLERMLEQVSGYVYVQARLGVTGAREDEMMLPRTRWPDCPTGTCPRRSASASDRRPRRAHRRRGADGIIVGSALVDIVAEGHENGDDAETVADRLETLARELKDGAVAGASQRPPHPERT